MLEELLLYVTALQHFPQVLGVKENKYNSSDQKGAKFNDEFVETHQHVKYEMEL